jgi:hypothetical protein
MRWMGWGADVLLAVFCGCLLLRAYRVIGQRPGEDEKYDAASRSVAPLRTWRGAIPAYADTSPDFLNRFAVPIWFATASAVRTNTRHRLQAHHALILGGDGIQSLLRHAQQCKIDPCRRMASGIFSMYSRGRAAQSQCNSEQ